MEKINDILNNIKDRLSNPLIFSFVCSWIVINWQITVALIWYDPKQIANEKCPSLFQFIIDRINSTDSFYYPLGMALLYTFAMPVVKNLIRAFNTWSTKWGEEWNLKILDGGKIGMDKFLKLRSDYKKAMQKLEEVISEESDYIDKNIKLNAELLELKSKQNETLNNLRDKEELILISHDFSILNGIWEVKLRIPGQQDKIETVEIIGGGYNIHAGFGNKNLEFSIKNFHYDKNRNEIFFVKEEVAGKNNPHEFSSNIFRINRLKFDGKDKLTGSEDKFQIEYNRKN